MTAAHRTGLDTPLAWALEYCSLGWSVVQVRRGEKRSRGRWAEYQRRKATRAELEAWFEAHPDDNVGIVTGIISDLMVVDVDPGHGGGESLEELTKQHGAMPKTVQAVSGGGGSHYYFRYPDTEVRNRTGIRAGIDVRAEGGYIVAPPSLHPSGTHYVWERARSPLDLKPARVPSWLLALASQPAHSAR